MNTARATHSAASRAVGRNEPSRASSTSTNAAARGACTSSRPLSRPWPGQSTTVSGRRRRPPGGGRSGPALATIDVVVCVCAVPCASSEKSAVLPAPQGPSSSSTSGRARRERSSCATSAGGASEPSCRVFTRVDPPRSTTNSATRTCCSGISMARCTSLFSRREFQSTTSQASKHSSASVFQLFHKTQLTRSRT